MTVVADSFDKPNGLAFSPDERVLYVTDSGANQLPGSQRPCVRASPGMLGGAIHGGVVAQQVYLAGVRER